MRHLHVAVAQIHSTARDPQSNLVRLHRQVQSAVAVGVEVILFAETCIHAYELSAENKAFAEPVGGPLTTQVGQWARQYGISILAGFIEQDGEQLYNSQLVARPDGTLAAQRKHSITPGEIEGGISAGPRARTVFTFNDVRCAVVICADTGIEGLADDLAAQGIDYCFIPTAGGGKYEDYLHEADLDTPEGRQRYADNRPRVFNTQAILSDCNLGPFASANAMGYDGYYACHQGHCMIVDRNRVLRAQIPGTIVLEHLQDQMAHAQLTF
jgi:predicted amidohydrolase